MTGIGGRCSLCMDAKCCKMEADRSAATEIGFMVSKQSTVSDQAATSKVYDFFYFVLRINIVQTDYIHPLKT